MHRAQDSQGHQVTSLSYSLDTCLVSCKHLNPKKREGYPYPQDRIWRGGKQNC